MTKIIPNKGKIVPIIPKGEPDVIENAIIVQNTPKIIAKIDPKKVIPAGPRPGFILFILNTPQNKVFIKIIIRKFTNF